MIVQKYKGFITGLMAFMATILVLELNKVKAQVQINDYRTFTTVFGGYDNTGKLRDIKLLQDNFFDHLSKISHLDEEIFQLLDTSGMKIQLE